ncbi:MAG: murein hydrolase activator EnvC family protein [Pseudanabaenaceae cyanobacterium]
MIWAIIVLGLIWSLLGLPAMGDPLDNVQEYQRLLKTQQELLNYQKQQLDRLVGPATNRLSALQQRVRATEAQMAANRQKLAQAQAQLTAVEQEWQRAAAKLTAQRQAAILRLRYLQRHPPERWWIALLGSRDVEEWARRRRQLTRLYDRDRRLLQQLQTTVTQVETQRQQVAIARNELALIDQQLTHQKAGYEAESRGQQRAVERLRRDRQSLELAEQRLQEDSRAITRYILSRSGNPAALSPGPGGLIYPIVAPISSSFGWRTHPILGTQRFHSGIDFAADYGTPIYATHGGTVIYADWYGGYGNTVILDRGDNLTTLYAHAEDLLVREGDTVQAGQAIATVGSTGFSTGPHLHFEIRVGGEPTDPLAYL